MGATEEQMVLLSEAHVTHVSYILILYSIAFLLFLFVNMLLHLYASHVWPLASGPAAAGKLDAEALRKNGRAGGGLNGHAMSGAADSRVRDAEEFELEGLISEGEDEGFSPGMKRTQRGA